MNVFISSVVRNFESYRAAAKKAALLLGHVPVMCEDFGAWPYSSQEACMTEVEQADVVVLVLGADFGFKTESGESVTQQEFRRARATGKPILAFLHDVAVEGPQQEFRWEVSDYVDGLFRATFTNEHELSDCVVRALNQLSTSRSAGSEAEFAQRLQIRNANGRWGGRDHETRLELAFLPQPANPGSLRSIHSEHESYFLKFCQAGLSTLKSGYEDFDRDELTGIDAPGLVWRHHDSGLSWLSMTLTNPARSSNHFDGYYVSPTQVRRLAEAAHVILCQGRGGWFQLSLHGVSYKVFAEPPAVATGHFTMSHRSEQELQERRLLIPATPAAYGRWLDDVMFKFKRKLSS
ncbi:DUF4062 domain-containing protein [Pseudomonas sp. YQ_5]|uniref:DUF4062 domain-containing protein n=1 Tax=Pseudomonas sp. YQ_5 TaxID=3367229 RepID=UPI003709DED7